MFKAWKGGPEPGGEGCAPTTAVASTTFGSPGRNARHLYICRHGETSPDGFLGDRLQQVMRDVARALEAGFSFTLPGGREGGGLLKAIQAGASVSSVCQVMPLLAGLGERSLCVQNPASSPVCVWGGGGYADITWVSSLRRGPGSGTCHIGSQALLFNQVLAKITLPKAKAVHLS